MVYCVLGPDRFKSQKGYEGQAVLNVDFESVDVYIKSEANLISVKKGRQGGE